MILYHKGKKGELRQWSVWTEGPDIITEHGVVGGKLQRSRKTAEPKNIGKANETTPEEQATAEAAALYTYKIQRKYSSTPEGAQETLPLPMLAHSFKGSKRKKFIYPAFLQPKLDGVRCLAKRDGDSILLTSRQGKPWTIPLVASQLEWLPEGMALDGELYTHGVSCQRVTSWAKSADPDGKSYKPESEALVYHVYDMPIHEGNDALPYSERCGLLMYHLQESDNVAKVQHIPISSEKELWTAYKSYMEEGYEGAMLRGADGIYIWGYRSADLLKVKEFQDAEFEVIDATEGVGAAKGCILFVCRNDLTDGTFKCTMKATVPERRQMYEERDQYIGKLLTVRFFDRTDDQIPRIFVGGIVFRDPIDLP